MSDDHRRGHVHAVATALFVTFLWSSSWVLIRWGLDDEALEPLTFAALRYGLAAIVLAAWISSRRSLRAGVRRLDSNTTVRIAVLGLVFYTVTQGAQFVAIDNQPAATTSLVLSWTPLLVALSGGRSIGESASGRQLVGALVVVAGAASYFSGDLGATTIGMAAALVGLGANTGASLLGRDVNRRADISPTVITAASMGVGAAALAGVGLAFEGIPPISLRGWAIIGWLAVVNTALAFTLWNLALRRLSALESAAINNTMLVQIAGLGWVFLGESLGVRELVGVALVSVGIFLTQTMFVARARYESPEPGGRRRRGAAERRTPEGRPEGRP